MFVPEKARETKTDEIEFVVNFEWPKKAVNMQIIQRKLTCVIIG